jgi:L-ribulose-5-phosphate 4-epimerase
MLEELKKRVFLQNKRLVDAGLVVLTWGNVSGISREDGLVVIKPSGVSYDTMTADDMVVVDMDGNVVEGKYRPSTDLATHLYLYKIYEDIGGVVHTHSTYATGFASSEKKIKRMLGFDKMDNSYLCLKWYFSDRIHRRNGYFN